MLQRKKAEKDSDDDENVAGKKTKGKKAVKVFSGRKVALVKGPLVPMKIKLNPEHEKQIKEAEPEPEPEKEKDEEQGGAPDHDQHQEDVPVKGHGLKISNLLQDVEREDVIRLLEIYGEVVSAEIRGMEAMASVVCSFEEAKDIVNELDRSLWMDNNIRVELTGEVTLPAEVKPKAKLEAMNKLMQKQRNRRRSSAMKEMESPSPPPAIVEPKSKQDRKIKVRNLFISAETSSKTFINDLRAIFSRYGTVASCTAASSNGRLAALGLMSSERQALNCISEANNVEYKGGRLQVKFEEGSEEDSEEYRAKHPVEFHDYPRGPAREALIPTSLTGKQAPTNSSALPIGALPPSSSLGAFGATPDFAQMAAIIKNAMQSQPATTSAQAAAAATAQPAPPSFPPELLKPSLSADPEYGSSFEGEVYSVHAKIVLVQFYTGFSFQFARFSPGQMFADGKRSLGRAMRDRPYHAWPAAVRAFLRQGARVRLDARRLREEEIAEVREATSQDVIYSADLVWAKTRARPDGEELALSMRSNRRVVKGVVARLYPKWGTLVYRDGSEVFFKVQQYLDRGGQLDAEASLLGRLAVGDALAALAEPVEYLKAAEIARNSRGFGEKNRTDSIRFMAQLVWQIGTEMDPFALLASDAEAAGEETFPAFSFLATSSTLKRQLPSEKEAQYRGWPCGLECLHMPAGGTLLADDTVFPNADISTRRVYFHRSRLFVDGVRLASHADLSTVAVPGDACEVDVVANAGDEGPLVELTGGSASWVAVAVRLNSRDRGAKISARLKGEVLVLAPARELRLILHVETGQPHAGCEGCDSTVLALPLAECRRERGERGQSGASQEARRRRWALAVGRGRAGCRPLRRPARGVRGQAVHGVRRAHGKGRPLAGVHIR